MAPRGRPTRTTRSRPVTATPPPVTATPPPVTDPTTTTSVTSAQLQAMIDEGVTAVLAARATTRNGDDSHTSGTGVRRNERTVRECTYQDFMKCQPLFFRGTEGVVNLTQWFERNRNRVSHKTVTNEWICNDVPLKILTKLKVSRWDARPGFYPQVFCGIEAKDLQRLIEMANELMDRRINTLAGETTKTRGSFEDAPASK
ncbi:hypothetical protein Tco_0921338 [Tanacetum coccineum]